jgi:hypothetical protein
MHIIKLYIYIDLICIIYIYTYAVYLDFHTWLGVVIVYPLIENFVWCAGWPSNIVVRYTGIPPRPNICCLRQSMACCKAKSSNSIKLTLFGFGPYISSISPYFTSSWVQIPHRLHDKGNPPFRFLVRWFSQP